MRAYLISIAVCAACLTSPAWAAAQGSAKNAEARVYFEEGNRLVREANDASDADRDTLLQRALEAYVDSLGIVRSRNALFNAAVTLEELGRHAESFNYYTEYLGISGLSETDRAEAEQRRAALQAEVAVLALGSEPGGAEVRIDREDLAPLGPTPIEVAVAPGPHQFFISKAGFVAATESVTVTIGERTATTIR
ncbi:MAG: PEGA domain-containing protein, partial [Polyangiales bacterium]